MSITKEKANVATAQRRDEIISTPDLMGVTIQLEGEDYFVPERVPFQDEKGRLSKHLYRQHLARYRWVITQIPGIGHKTILDVPCGVGYGSEILARKAKNVVGVDQSEDALTQAREKFGVRGRKFRPNASFRLMNALELDFPSESFDSLVCLEGIEHVSDPQRLLGEFARLLKPGGDFIVSTPNRNLTPATADGKPLNPHHIQEFTWEELTRMLETDFEQIKYFGQDIIASTPPTSSRVKIARALMTLDVFNLRRFVSPSIKSAIAGKPKEPESAQGAAVVAEKDIRGEPLIWIATCKKKLH